MKPEDKIFIAKLNVTLGNLSLDLQLFENAIKEYKSAREIFKVNGQHIAIAKCDHQIGIAYDYIGEFEEAEKYFNSSYEVFKDKILLNAAFCKMSLGILNAKRTRFKEAEKDIITAQDIFKENKYNTEIPLAKSYLNLAALYAFHRQ